jgi:glutathione S-transferase
VTVLTLYDFALDEGCYKIRLLLGALGLPFETVPVNMVPGAEQAQPPLLAKNPLGTLPILEHDDGAGPLVLREAEAILGYLACRFDASRLWLPAEPIAFGAVMGWLIFAARDLDAAVRARRSAMWGEAGDGPVLEAAARRAYRHMDDHMTARGFAGGAWFVGEAPTIADIALFPSFALSRDIGIDHEAFPALRHWLRRVRALPGFVVMPGIPDYV